ncbi:MAG: 30S ribosomal protein S16 [Anaerolineae bacterium]|nr:30S ribosomal protein S16 [Anaerolineae bacterium]
MVKIRLRRMGAKKQPSYRVVVADSRSPRDGRFLEIIGHYNPRTEPAVVNIQEDRVLHWLSEGAQMTEPVERLLKNLGTLERFARLKEGADLVELLAEAEATREKRVEETQAKPAKAGAKKTKKRAAVKEETTEAKAETEAVPEIEDTSAEAPEIEASETGASETEGAEIEASAKVIEEVTEDAAESSSEDDKS